METLKDTWGIHVRQTELILGYLSHEQLIIQPERGGRTIGAILAHLVNNRLDWIEPIAPALVDDLNRIAKTQNTDLLLIQDEYQKSAHVVMRLIDISQKSKGKIKGFDGTISTFIAYLIAHEWYHIGEIGMILGQVGQAIPKNKAYDLWDWREKYY